MSVQKYSLVIMDGSYRIVDIDDIIYLPSGNVFTTITGTISLDDLVTSLANLHKIDILDFVETDYVHTTGIETIGGNKTFSNNVIVNGDLTVNGTHTSVESVDMKVKDNVIIINDGETGHGVTAGAAGLSIYRGPADLAYNVIWNELTSKLIAGLAGSESQIAFLSDIVPDPTKADKIVPVTLHNIATLDASGNLEDGGHLLSEYVTDISMKADKSVPSVTGNFAGLDSAGNLEDSGSKTSDFATAVHTHTDKADKIVPVTTHNIATLDASGDLEDSGHLLSEYVTDISGKADKVSSPTANNFAGLNLFGNLIDSGSKASDFITDISMKSDKLIPAVDKNVAVLDGTTGNLVDGGHQLCEYVTDISGKADKFVPATLHNIATLDAAGDLEDSGHLLSEYVTDISGKADKAVPTVANNIAVLDAAGDLVDSTHQLSEYVTDISGKTDKIIPAVTHNIATLSASGNLEDGGSLISAITTYTTNYSLVGGVVSVSGDGATATVTQAAHGYKSNMLVTIAGTTHFDGAWPITVTGLGSYTFVFDAYTGGPEAGTSTVLDPWGGVNPTDLNAAINRIATALSTHLKQSI